MPDSIITDNFLSLPMRTGFPSGNPRGRAGKLIKLAILLLAISACNGPMSPERYVKWVTDPENGFRQVRDCGDYKLDLQYQSTNFLTVTNSGLMEKEDAQLHHFMLEITPTQPGYDLIALNKANPQIIQKRRDYFAFELEKEISLHAQSDERKCSLFHMENTFNMKSGRTFLIAFKKDNADQKLTLQIHSKLIDKQPIKFTFDLTEEPEIRL